MGESKRCHGKGRPEPKPKSVRPHLSFSSQRVFLFAHPRALAVLVSNEVGLVLAIVQYLGQAPGRPTPHSTADVPLE